MFSGFVWAANADGTVTIQFDNGDETQYVLYSDAGKFLFIGSLANGLTKTATGDGIDFDGVTEFPEANLLNRRYRAVWVDVDDEFDAWDFLFLPGGDGCLIFDVLDGGEIVRSIIWESTADNSMDSFRNTSNANPQIPFQRRKGRAW